MQLDDALSDEATRILATMFTAHGVTVGPDGDFLVFPGHPYRACASIFTHPEEGGRTSVQLDLRFTVDDGRVLVESCAGFGDTLMGSVHNAIASMAQNSLHVVLHAFFACVCDQANEERWTIAGQSRRVILGLVTGRGEPPPAAMDPGLWFPTLVGLIQAAPLPPGTHWVRMYYAHHKRRLLVSEVMVDNEEMPGWQDIVTGLPWPETDGFYSRRWFVIIRDAKDG